MNKIPKILSMMLLIPIITFCHDVPSSDVSKVEALTQNNRVANETTAKPTNQCQPQCDSRQAECHHVEYFNTPAYQSRTNMRLPKDAILEIENHFIRRIKKSSIVASAYSADVGWVDYSDDKSLSFSFLNDGQSRNGIYYTSPYQGDMQLSAFDQQMFLKIIALSGSDNPEVFLKELLTSEPIDHCADCVIKQKPSTYGMIELSFCEIDNTATFSLYAV